MFGWYIVTCGANRNLPHGILIEICQIKFKSIFRVVGWIKYLPTYIPTYPSRLNTYLIYKSNSGGVCLYVWAVPGRFFQSLPVPCGASPNVTSPDVTDSREKRNQGQFDFLRQKIW
jgi:hypothetical protein